jgi:hypothetical protein
MYIALCRPAARYGSSAAGDRSAAPAAVATAIVK